MSAARNARRCRVVACRGCCCGNPLKHPDADHAAQVARLSALPTDRAAMTVSGCLGNCEHSNTVVVIPSPAGRALGATVVWFGRMLSAQLTDVVTQWIEDGGPGFAPMPDLLRLHQVDPPRRTSTT